MKEAWKSGGVPLISEGQRRLPGRGAIWTEKGAPLTGRDPKSPPFGGCRTMGLRRTFRDGYLLKYSCLENSMDRGDWQATVHGSQRIEQDWATNTPTYQGWKSKVWREVWWPYPSFSKATFFCPGGILTDAPCHSKSIPIWMINYSHHSCKWFSIRGLNLPMVERIWKEKSQEWLNLQICHLVKQK